MSAIRALLAQFSNHQNINFPFASTTWPPKCPFYKHTWFYFFGELFKSRTTFHCSDSEAIEWVPCPHERRLWTGPVRTRVLRTTHAFALRPPPTIWTPMFSCFLPSSPKSLQFSHFLVPMFECSRPPPSHGHAPPWPSRSPGRKSTKGAHRKQQEMGYFEMGRQQQHLPRRRENHS